MHNKEWYLKRAVQKLQYLEFMNQDLESEKYENGSRLEAVTIMSNHTHELSHITDQKLYSRHMQRHHSRFGRYYNDLKTRCGKVAQDRPHTTLIADDHHRMICTFYIHANQHRAKIREPERYEYSTHKLYAFGKRSPWMRNIKFPSWYLRLGRTMALRRQKYRELFARYLKKHGMTKQKSQKARFLGDAQWIKENETVVAEWRRSAREAPA